MDIIPCLKFSSDKIKSEIKAQDALPGSIFLRLTPQNYLAVQDKESAGRLIITLQLNKNRI